MTVERAASARARPRTATLKQKSAHTPPADPALLEETKRRNQARNTRANLISVVMILLTLCALAYIAWQLNHPITLYISRLFGG